MQPISSYTDDNDRLRLILQGPPGSGKTTLASQFPRAHIIDIDVNLGGTLRFLTEKKLTLPVSFDVLDRDEKGIVVPLPQRYARLDACLKAAGESPDIDTIVIDSGTTLSEVMIAEVLRQQQKSEMSKREWGFFATLARHFLGVLRQVRKHIVLIVHEKTEKLESGAIVYPIKVAWPGQVGQNIGAYFTNVWRCEVDVVAKGMSNEYKWLIRTMPDAKYELKNSLGLPAKFEFKWETIAEKLK
jgi:hypothetical protein